VIIRLDARELEEILRLTPPDQNILLAGRHGIGKSEIITRYYRQKGMRVVSFFLGQMSDPGDLLGLMHKEEETGRSIFLPPYWWPDDGEAIVLFLDELNRARPELLQSIFDLVLNKTLAGRKLPEGSVIISAVNKGDEYQLTDLDPALVSRFNLYEFAPTVEDWLIWAGDNELDPRVISFLQRHPEQLDGAFLQAEESWQATGLIKRPDRRAWRRVSDFLKPVSHPEELHIKLLAGMVGAAAASSFRQSLKATGLVSAEHVLREFPRHRKKLEKFSMATLTELNEAIMLWLLSHDPDPAEAQAMQANLLLYLQTLKKRKQNEALAHLAALMESPKLEKASAFLAASFEIVSLMTDYIEGIQT